MFELLTTWTRRWGLVVVIVLALLLAPAGWKEWIRRAVHGISLPVLSLSSSLQSVVTGSRPMASRGELLSRIRQLEEENARLRFELSQREALLAENRRLRQLLGWQQRSAVWKTVAARVVLRDSHAWWHEIWIDRGAADGVRLDLPVITPEGLVGRIVEVHRSSSRVLLLGSPRLRVAAMIQETGEQGIVGPAPDGILDYNLVILSYLPQSAQLWSGQAVVTSGIGGVFPEGLLIGHIIDWRPVEYGLYLEARVRLAASINKVREVLVVLL